MPKITDIDVQGHHDGIHYEVRIPLHYSSDLMFHSIMPEEHNMAISFFTNEELKEFSLKKEKRGKLSYSHSAFRWVVSCETEKEVRTHSYHLLTKLIAQKSVRRPVIVVWFEHQKDRQSAHEWNLQRDPFQRLSLGFRMRYLTEIAAGNTKKYFHIYFRKDPWGSGKEQEEMDQEHVNHTRGATVVIDDTPENRAKLEALYNALDKLIDKLKEVCGSPESVLEFVQSNVKLLS